MSPVLDYIFSHSQVSKKNVLVTMLIVRPLIRLYQIYICILIIIIILPFDVFDCVGSTLWA